MVNAECRVENKTDRMHTTVGLEDSTIGSIIGKGSGIALRAVSAEAMMKFLPLALWAVDINKESGKTDIVDTM